VQEGANVVFHPGPEGTELHDVERRPLRRNAQRQTPNAAFRAANPDAGDPSSWERSRCFAGLPSRKIKSRLRRLGGLRAALRAVLVRTSYLGKAKRITDVQLRDGLHH
jgi:hypothetical protein